MSKRKTLLAVSLTLGLSGLVAALAACGRDPAPAPEAREAPPKGVSSCITQVTVYPNNALVTREVEVPAGSGTLELVVTPLPEHTINSSLYSEGSDGIRVLSTRFRTRPVREDTREEVRKLEDEIKKLQLEAQKIQADIQANEQNMALVGKLENFTSATTQNATEKGKLDSETTIALAKYLMEGRTEKTREGVTLRQQLQANQEQSAFAQRKLSELTAGSSKTERDAVLVVDKTRQEAGKVRLNYLVDMASWRPQYKFRTGEGVKEGKEVVQVECLAAVMQQSGEDWQGVHLVLSTAQPMLNAAPPELKMLAVTVAPKGTAVAGATLPPAMPPGGGGGSGGTGLGVAAGGMPGATSAPQPIANPAEGKASVQQLNEAAQVYRRRAQEEDNRKNDVQAAELSNYAAALEQARDLVLLADEKTPGGPLAGGSKNEGPSVTYHLNARLTVPSRNDEQVLEVARLELKPDYFYKAVPVLSPHVYRQANLSNSSKYVLLPGEATMYDGSDFVGRMNLPLVAVGEQFTVGFGAEPQLQVQRVLTDKSRTMQGGNQVLKYEYRILVSSFKRERVKVQVWDRLPHAENETMGVTLVKASPEVSSDPLYTREDRPFNLLRWDLEVDPGSNGERAQAVNYEFKLELDRQLNIGTFQSKSAR